jgi:hypothetical protein
MILSVSRRTDIPNYYSQWFFNRLKEGYVLVRNPMNIHHVSKIPITADTVDCIVFWTKNPAPMLERLHELDNYHYYFQFTVNSYGSDIEPNVPKKSTSVISTFQELSDKIGPDRIIWRYDPILINDYYTIDYHIKYFAELAKRLQGYTKRCTISFIDIYRKNENNAKKLAIKTLSLEDKYILARSLVETATCFGMKIDTCSEDIDLSTLNIAHARCIDKSLVESMLGYTLITEKDKGQRRNCGCSASVDIGMYNTCPNNCKYCYANYSVNTVKNNIKEHDDHSPLLFGKLTSEDIISDRVLKPLKSKQLKLTE